MSDAILRGVLLAVALIVFLPLVWMTTGLFGAGTHMGGGLIGGGLFGLVPLLLLVLFGYGLYVALVDDDSEQETDAALDELRRAYARGDLSDEEFERRRERLRRNR
ncbi:SHOCT domain-containing protein [Natranaeroarchaeum sulfidigenes]|nr:SHOCT domain-containing protein [Natranaeroarchaeum sulfidigenes]